MWIFHGICLFVTDDPELKPSSNGVQVVLPDVHRAIGKEGRLQFVAHHETAMEFNLYRLLSPANPLVALADLGAKLDDDDATLLRIPLIGHIVEIGSRDDPTVHLERMGNLSNLHEACGDGKVADDCLGNDCPTRPVAARFDLFGGTLSCDGLLMKPSAFAPKCPPNCPGVPAGPCYKGSFASAVCYVPPTWTLRIRPFGSSSHDGFELEFRPGSAGCILNDCSNEDDVRCKEQDPEHFSAFYDVLETPPDYEDRPLPFFGHRCTGKHDPKVQAQHIPPLHTGTGGSGCIPSKGHGGP